MDPVGQHLENVLAAATRACGSCNAPMVLVPTGKDMIPINPDPAPDGNVVLHMNRGELTATVLTQDDLFTPAGAPRWISHFATCPDADQWRETSRAPRKPDPR